MGKQQDREKIVQEIKVAADLYRKHLVGKKDFYMYLRADILTCFIKLPILDT